MHKCQGMSQLLPLPGVTEGFGSGPRAYRLRDTVLPGGVNRPDPEMFDGVDTALSSLAGYAGAQPPAALTAGLTRIASSVADARAALAAKGSAAAVAPLAVGLRAVRGLRTELAGMGVNDGGRYEIDVRLGRKEAQFEQALVLAADVRLEAVADDDLVIGGQGVGVRILAANRGEAPVEFGSTLAGFQPPVSGTCEPEPLAAKASRNCRMNGIVALDARLTAAHFKYATDVARFDLDPDVPPGLPFRPTPFVANVTLRIGGEPVAVAVQCLRSEGDLYSGEKRAELHVVPKFAVTASPEILIVPTTVAAGAQLTRDVRVTVVNHWERAATADVSLVMPQGGGDAGDQGVSSRARTRP